MDQNSNQICIKFTVQDLSPGRIIIKRQIQLYYIMT